jgi:drug/metabolite transporter (DMT)-like permease
MTHRRALGLMVLVTLLWSTAGAVSRQLESARSFEVTFWRSAFTLLALLAWWGLRQGRAGLMPLLSRSPLLWASGLCWATMFTAFMLALTLTEVAKVLVVMSLGPLFTALLARFWLGARLSGRTLAAVMLAGLGVAWMFSGEGLHMGWGPLVALAVPLAAACNFVLLQRHVGTQVSLPHAVALGALLSSLLTLPLAWPFEATQHDLLWLAFLGAFQLALPCVLMVHLSRVLSATEISLLALLELVFGVAWAWSLAGEELTQRSLSGASLVVVALIWNELNKRSGGPAPRPLA